MTELSMWNARDFLKVIMYKILYRLDVCGISTELKRINARIEANRQLNESRVESKTAIDIVVVPAESGASTDDVHGGIELTSN